MEETRPTVPEQRSTDRVTPWEIALAAVVLVACLLGGLALADLQAPGPVVGVLRFSEVIDFDTSAQIVDLLEAARNDPAIAGLVLELSSPGGYATSSETIFYSLLNFRQTKPLVVVVDGMAASGGYYMAAAANRIFAPPSSYVGNVGTRGGRPSDPMLAPDELSSGPYKLEGGSRFEQIHQLDLVRNAFVANVVTQRTHAEINPLKLTAAELAEARLYLGSEALALGMIDGEGSRAEGVTAAAALAGLTEYQVVDLPTYLGLPPIGVVADPVEEAQALLAAAPPGAIFMLDSRIPFPDAFSAQAPHSLRKPRGGITDLLNTAPASTFADLLAPAQP
jgi:protease-4